MADTAFSDTSTPDNRGVAQSEVTLYLRTRGAIGSRPDVSFLFCVHHMRFLVAWPPECHHAQGCGDLVWFGV